MSDRTPEIDRDELLSRLPDGWGLDPLDDDDPYCVVAENLDTDAKLSRSVVVEVESPDHDHYNPKYWAAHVAANSLPNVGPDEEMAEFETLDAAVDQAVAWATDPP